jgi:ABC-type Mn2+/Zn2+ transport system ATPase subunit
MTSAYKDVVMIGGPNGAGKTTTATTMLPKELRIREL